MAVSKRFIKFTAFKMIWFRIIHSNRLNQEYSDASITQSIKIEFVVKKQILFLYFT